MKASNLLDKINEHFGEAKHQNTKVRQTYEKAGSRKARLTVKEAKRMCEQMLDRKHPSPNPKGDVDRVYLKEACAIMTEAMSKLKTVKETKKKNESIDEKLGKVGEMVGSVLDSMIRGKFKGDADQLIDSFEDEIEYLGKGETKYMEAAAKALLALYKAVK